MRKLFTILNAVVKNGTPWRHAMAPVCVEAWESLDLMAIVVPMPIVRKEFSRVNLKRSSSALDGQDSC